MEFVQQVAAQIPWGHTVVLPSKVKDEGMPAARLFAALFSCGTLL